MENFADILNAHQQRYPLMQPQDYGKLAYQSALGPEHMIADETRAAAFIREEWQSVQDTPVPCNPEPIGGGLCRLHMTRAAYSPETAAQLATLFIQTAREHTGTPEDLQALLPILAALPVRGMAAWLTTWQQQGCPPVHHSESFRNAYQPHYRLLCMPLAQKLLR